MQSYTSQEVSVGRPVPTTASARRAGRKPLAGKARYGAARAGCRLGAIVLVMPCHFGRATATDGTSQSIGPQGFPAMLQVSRIASAHRPGASHSVTPALRPRAAVVVQIAASAEAAQAQASVGAGEGERR